MKIRRKSGSQIDKDTFGSVFDNGGKIIDITPATKTTSITSNYLLNKKAAQIFRDKATLCTTLKATGGNSVPIFVCSVCLEQINIFDV